VFSRSQPWLGLANYLSSLLESELPFDAWIVVLAWATLFAANHWIARSARVANDSQYFVAVEDLRAVRRGFEPKYVATQILLALTLFQLAFLLGRPAFVFLAGGLLVAMTFAIALNIQALLSARTLGLPNAAKGALTLTTASAFRQMASRAAGIAIGCCLLGFALAHLALLGGALVLALTAIGYLRRARRANAQS
jgi:hypothetical protein